jgi:hypothetical protein
MLIACRDQTTEELNTPTDGTSRPTLAPGGAGTAAATSAVQLPPAAADEEIAPEATALTEQPTASPTSPPPATLTATTAPPPTETVVPAWLSYDGPSLRRADMGLQIHLHREDLAGIMANLRDLGVGWVKVQVSWKIYQPEPNRFDDFRFEELDGLIAAAAENDIKVLLGVAKAPEWSRPTTELDGPPGDYAFFESFMSTLATRYRGRVAAYELWNEANLQREWNGAPLSAASLVELVRAGAAGVRAADPEAILISGAPATTGINDGIVAIDDRQYLGQMVAAGVAGVVDAVGAHPYGWANPPDSSAYTGTPATSSHNDHPSFYFADTLADYRQILDGAGHGQTPIWVTEFGWGSYDGLESQPPAGLEYMAEVNETQQAIYTRRAFEIAQDLPNVGPLILWNLNFGPTFGAGYAESSYSLLRPDGARRPIFEALATVPKQ